MFRFKLKEEKKVYFENNNLIHKINPKNLTPEQMEEINTRISAFSRFSDLIRERNSKKKNNLYFLLAILFGIFANILVSLLWELYKIQITSFAFILILVIIFALIGVIIWYSIVFKTDNKTLERLWAHYEFIGNELKERGMEFGRFENKKTLYGKIIRWLKNSK